MTFNIGDTAYLARFEVAERHVTCPDCAGTGRIKAIIADGSEYALDCAACERGYMGSVGYLIDYDRTPRAEETTIGGVEVTLGQPVEYKFNVTHRSWNTAKECDLFATEAEALSRAEELAAAAKAEQDARMYRKEKDTKTWAWHVHYHRKCIADAEKQIAYHSQKLGIAKVKEKEAA